LLLLLLPSLDHCNTSPQRLAFVLRVECCIRQGVYSCPLHEGHHHVRVPWTRKCLRALVLSSSCVYPFFSLTTATAADSDNLSTNGVTSEDTRTRLEACTTSVRYHLQPRCSVTIWKSAHAACIQLRLYGVSGSSIGWSFSNLPAALALSGPFPSSRLMIGCLTSTQD
jgi:hypothetical protein